MRKLIFKKVFKRDFVRNIFTLLSGTVLAQAITLGMLPIVTRIYSPEEYGVFTIFVSVSSMVAIISTGRYEIAILLPKKERHVYNLVFLSFIILISITLIVAMGTSVVDLISDLLSNVDFSELFYLLPFTVFSYGCYQILFFIKNREKKYKQMAISRMNQSLVNGVSSVLLGLIGLGATGLVIGYTLSFFIPAMYLFINKEKSFMRGLKKEVSKLLIKRNLIKYREMPIYNSLHAFLDMAMINVTLLIISYSFGAGVVAFYGFTIRVLKAPLGLIGFSISRVYNQRASEKINQGENITSLLLNIVTKLSMVAAPIFICISIFGSEIFSFIFGIEWAEAGVYAQILSPWLFFNFIGSPIAQTFVLLQKQKQAFYYSAVQTSVFLGAVFVSSFTSEILFMLKVISFVGSLLTIIFGMWIYSITLNNNNNNR
ncbi:oligosaccharide flippase family protein [Halobacillus litoralis]|uniref:lipopolysaccharide biosynthesis protein n=1 Tax=Halobacillus litoralis TaxID=45668 RepID=UPI001CD72854|nr:oligosaccharide flippase family protein [Halobacillus litoralis]MCA0970935.1 oligosaccharide flippase family protein [Halobacillus litoralis]